VREVSAEHLQADPGPFWRAESRPGEGIPVPLTTSEKTEKAAVAGKV
jgi:hypothetical protein